LGRCGSIKKGTMALDKITKFKNKKESSRCFIKIK
jgi:hypothetical protein